MIVPLPWDDNWDGRLSSSEELRPFPQRDHPIAPNQDHTQAEITSIYWRDPWVFQCQEKNIIIWSFRFKFGNNNHSSIWTVNFDVRDDLTGIRKLKKNHIRTSLFISSFVFSTQRWSGGGLTLLITPLIWRDASSFLTLPRSFLPRAHICIFMKSCHTPSLSWGKKKGFQYLPISFHPSTPFKVLSPKWNQFVGFAVWCIVLLCSASPNPITNVVTQGNQSQIKIRLCFLSNIYIVRI